MRRILLPLGAIAVIVAHNLLIQPWMLDDAFISFRYAENLASGNGPVFNIGEKVEGYTCFLWVTLLALGKYAGITPVFFSRVLGFLFSIGAILLLARAHRLSGSISERSSILAALFLGTSGIFTPWAGSGMEVSLFTSFLLLCVLLAASGRSRAGLGVCLALLAMTRPEGVLVAGLIFLSDLPSVLRSREWGRLALPVGIFVAIYGAYFAWRWSYYGYFLPNTFYAKVGSTSEQVVRGLRYFLRFVSAALPLVLLAPAAFRHAWNSNLRAAVLVLAGYSLYVIAVGGDIMPSFRFFAPVLPLLAILAAEAVSRMKRQQTVVLVALLVVCSNLLLLMYHPQMHPYITSDTVAEEGKEVGDWLRTHAAPDAVIATNTSGSIPYYSQLRVIDMLGLNDAHIAHRHIDWIGTGPAGHEKGDGAYVLSRGPDYIQFGSSLGDTIPRFLSDQELWRLPEFHSLYERKTYELPSGRSLILFEKREESAP